MYFYIFIFYIINNFILFQFNKLSSLHYTTNHRRETPLHLWLALHIYSRICLFVFYLSQQLHKEANDKPMKNLCTFVNTQMEMISCSTMIGLPLLILL